MIGYGGVIKCFRMLVRFVEYKRTIKRNVSLIANTFLKGQALRHLVEVIFRTAKSPYLAIYMLQSHFLDDRANRAKQVNCKIWMELDFDLVKKSRSSKDNTLAINLYSTN